MRRTLKITALLSFLVIVIYFSVVVVLTEVKENGIKVNGVKMNEVKIDSNILKVGFPSHNEVSFYEPTRIHLADEYIFLESIYSTLINLSDDKGTPISSIAKEHYWKGQELHFVIRDDLSTIDGHPISVNDVIFSLKRLLVLSENTHGDFRSLVCPEIEIKTVDDDCPGITKKDNTLVLKPKSKRDFLVSMLAAIDFAIIPKVSVDPRTLRIIDYRNTTGPYYVEQDKGAGNIILRANPKHFVFSKSMASEIQLIPTKGMNKNQVVEWFQQGKIDHLTTIEGLQVEGIKGVDRSQTNFHETIHIKSKLAFITKKGMERLSIKRRLAFAKSLQKSFHEFYSKKEGYRQSNQFLLPLGEGNFSKDEAVLLKKVMDSVEMDRSGKGIRLDIFNVKEGDTQTATFYMPNLKVERSKGIPAFTQLSEEAIPDYIIVSTDSGFLDDIGFLSYSIKAGVFGLSVKEGGDWLKDYMDTEDKKERIRKLKKMHLEALIEGRMIPLVTSSWIAIARKPWSLQLSELFANNPLWKIRKN